MVTRRVREDGLSVRLTWNERAKKWILSYSWRDGSAWRHAWLWVDTSMPVGASEAELIAKRIRAEMESWLPWKDGD